MNNKIRHIFIFIFIFSVFSLTLQASVIQLCKESKFFKNLNLQSSSAEEEEEEKSHEGNEAADEDIVYLIINDHSNYNSEINLFFFKYLELAFSSIPLDILIPPPKI